MCHDLDVVLLQEMWDTELNTVLALRCFHIHHVSVWGPRRGLCILMHRRCVCGEVKPARVALHDNQDWQALLVAHIGGDSVLYVNAHFDPKSNCTARENMCAEVGVLIKRTSARGVVFAGDCNTRSTTSHVAEGPPALRIKACRAVVSVP